VVAISKAEIIDEKKKKIIRKNFKKVKITPIFFSAATNTNIDGLLEVLFKLLQ